MPRFTTISPTHIPGKKLYAWSNFRKGGYIAIGWWHEDFTGKSIDKVISFIREQKSEYEGKAIDAFEKFFSLDVGDYVAVPNVQHGLFGVGQITSGYKFELYKHDTGSDDQNGFYSHYREVQWKHTQYVSRDQILDPGEKGWQPYGTVGKIIEKAPSYILRLLGESIPRLKAPESPTIVVPDDLKAVIEDIKLLRSDKNHVEKSHESLVEDFFCALGYAKYQDIKLGRVDVSIWAGDNPLMFIETKRDWNLSVDNDGGAVRQVYGYALERGVRYVAITNGDYYAVFDRLKGLSYTSNIIAEFTLTALQEEDVGSIDRLRRDALLSPSLEETFQHLCECFEISE